MKKIYIVLTFSGTILSRLIKMYTKDKYTHVSISLDSNLNNMYSFGRLNPYNAFVGGFVQESPDYGTFKRFKNSNVMIYSLDIEENKYNHIVQMIKHFKENKQKYKFNILGLFCVAINKRIKKQNSFYCAEFIKYLLDESKIDNNLPEIVKPSHFLMLNKNNTVYTGLLNKYDRVTNYY